MYNTNFLDVDESVGSAISLICVNSLLLNNNTLPTAPTDAIPMSGSNINSDEFAA